MKQKKNNNIEVPAYNLGGIFSGAASMAGAGMSIGGPWGAAIGGVVGAVSGLFGESAVEKRARQLQEMQERQVKVQRNAAQSQQYTTNWWENNELVPTFNMGGVPGFNPNAAMVGPGEVLKYGDETKVVGDMGNPNAIDNTLVPTPDAVLGNLNIPGTKKTFAGEGRNNKKRFNRTSIYTDKIAQDSEKLNQLHENQEYDKLLALQEEVKMKKRIKPKTKKVSDASVVAANAGFGTDINWLALQNQLNGIVPNALAPLNGTGNWSDSQRWQANTHKPSWTPAGNQYDAKIAPSSNGVNDTGVKDTTPPKGFNLGNAINVGGQLIPTMYNLIKGAQPSEQTPLVTNQYAENYMSAMDQRKINISPVRNALGRSRATQNYQANQFTNTGQRAAYMAATGADYNSKLSDLLVGAQMQNNEYRADAGKAKYAVGTDKANALVYKNEQDAMSRARNRDFTGTAMSQLGQFFGNQAMRSAQSRQNDAMLTLLRPYLNTGMTSADLAQLYSQLS